MNNIDTLKLALEALESMAHGQDLYELEERAITAIKQALAQDALHKMAEESRTSGLRLDDWDKIVCVNHDCDQCKAQPAVPEGWKLVPVEPTKEMAIAYWQFNDRQDVRMIDAWKAMLEAAPEKGQP